MSAPYSLENTLRIHDEVVNDWLGTLLVDYGEIAGTPRLNHPILRVMAAPQRAFAEIVPLLVSQGWISGADAAEKSSNASAFAVVPLPLCSWERADPTPNLEASGVPKVFRRFGTDEFGANQAHRWPSTWKVTYRASFWSLKRYTDNYMLEWLMSQFGELGGAETELFLDVPHAEPHGTQKQALKLASVSREDDLEGEDNQRYYRFVADFEMNLLHFRPVLDGDQAGAPLLDNLSLETSFLLDGDCVLDTPPVLNLCPATLSGNAFRPFYDAPLIASKWPVAGNATIGVSELQPEGAPKGSAYVLNVEADTDEVALTTFRACPDADGQSMLLISFRTLATAAAVLEVAQKADEDAAYETLALETVGPVTEWKRATYLVLATDEIVSVGVKGAGTAATIRLHDISVRRVLSGTKLVPAQATVGSEEVFTWTGLEGGAYLLILEASSGTGSVVAESAAASPGEQITKPFDAASQKGLGFLISPETDTLVLRVPDAVGIVSVRAQKYDGPYAGHQL